MHVEGGVVDRDTYFYRAMMQRTDFNEDLVAEGSIIFADIQDFGAHSIKTLGDWAGKSIWSCVDNDGAWIPNFRVSQWESARDLFGNASINSCTDVEHYCFLGNEKGNFARFLCPHTCGGDHFASGQYMTLPADGFPDECKKWQDSLKQMLNCKDIDAAELRKMPGWRNYGVSINSVWDQRYRSYSVMPDNTINWTHYHWMQEELLDGMNKSGRAYFSSPRMIRPLLEQSFPVDYCWTDHIKVSSRRSVRPFCPETCGCDEGWMDGQCPGPCAPSTAFF